MTMNPGLNGMTIRASDPGHKHVYTREDEAPMVARTYHVYVDTRLIASHQCYDMAKETYHFAKLMSETPSEPNFYGKRVSFTCSTPEIVETYVPAGKAEAQEPQIYILEVYVGAERPTRTWHSAAEYGVAMEEALAAVHPSKVVLHKNGSPISSFNTPRLPEEALYRLLVDNETRYTTNCPASAEAEYRRWYIMHSYDENGEETKGEVPELTLIKNDEVIRGNWSWDLRVYEMSLAGTLKEVISEARIYGADADVLVIAKYEELISRTYMRETRVELIRNGAIYKSRQLGIEQPILTKVNDDAQ
jgi:hypothetical protein